MLSFRLEEQNDSGDKLFFVLIDTTFDLGIISHFEAAPFQNFQLARVNRLFQVSRKKTDSRNENYFVYIPRNV